MALQPIQPRLLFDLVEAAAHRILAHHLRHAQQASNRRGLTGSQRNVVMCA
jgi:hypothetical protein